VTYVPKRAHDSRDSEIFYTGTDILKIHSMYFPFSLILLPLILQVKLSFSKCTSFNGCWLMPIIVIVIITITIIINITYFYVYILGLLFTALD